MAFQMLLCGECYENVYTYGVQAIFHGVEQWIVCMPLSVKVFMILPTQQHLEYHCKALFFTPCIT
jgi:hypothetical protein